MNVAVDAMGGDKAPGVVVQGALEAVSEQDLHVTLIGPEDELRQLPAFCSIPDRINVHHCEEIVGMDESPLSAVRKKKDSSIRVAFDLAKEGKVDAVVSAGNSGAMMAAATLTLGTLKGVDRPAIAGILSGERGNVILIDVGANVDCKPTHLLQFGVMAQAFVSSCMGVEDPRIGILNIGEEGGKGNEQVRLARKLLEKSNFNFVGNVEGRDLLSGDVEIIICDGFVGNVVLKLSEGMAESLIRMLRVELTDSFMGRVALRFGRRSFDRLKLRVDYEEYGGAPLLGINGVGIVCHGGSSARAIGNAIKLAGRFVRHQVVEKMSLQLKGLEGMMAPG
ncbi:MAG: phosphate acyltransferase PlsX [Desulfatiglans sp.]|jgi:glycerol-3-phosphate acyltransferase PlsX|nr:phosphate acyltransferase PlsX [Thermodesulfobacteriota bacterium]MEE4353820.1 phosphate acyltransferase PlsX [Desulfatiglans sp.]